MANKDLGKSIGKNKKETAFNTQRTSENFGLPTRGVQSINPTQDYTYSFFGPKEGTQAWANLRFMEHPSPCSMNPPDLDRDCKTHCFSNDTGYDRFDYNLGGYIISGKSVIVPVDGCYSFSFQSDISCYSYDASCFITVEFNHNGAVYMSWTYGPYKYTHILGPAIYHIYVPMPLQYITPAKAGDTLGVNVIFKNTAQFGTVSDFCGLSSQPTIIKLVAEAEHDEYTGAGLDWTNLTAVQNPYLNATYNSGSGGTGTTSPGGNYAPPTDGYMPIFRYQIGDPTTWLDAFICGFEAGAMALDWHTRGGIQVWGGTLAAHSGKTAIELTGGQTLQDIQNSWAYYGQTLSNRTGDQWVDLMTCMTEGRAAVLQGDYDQFGPYSCQPSFLGDHSVVMLPYYQNDSWLVGDPLCRGFKYVRASVLRAYLEKFGAHVFGIMNANYQPICYAVSRGFA